MKDMRIEFLGSEYVIPEDVLVYLELLAFTEEIKTSLLNSFKQKVWHSDVGCIEDKDMSEEINQQVGKYISLLCNKGIYNRTINDYLRNNKGYDLFSQVNKAAFEKAKAILIDKIDTLKTGVEDALYKKDASVTGMGFSIWSGSFVNHAIYAAMQASTIRDQEKAANIEYQKDMDKLHAKMESDENKAKSEYLYNVYIPNMEVALTVFAYELLDKYISDLIENGLFDKRTLSYIDLARSNELLDNLNLSQNKKVILENAFVSCPYNIAVYMQAMKIDLLDYKSFQIAKLFKQDKLIISFLRENLGRMPGAEKQTINFKIAEQLALYTDSPLRDITQYMADYIVSEYSKIIALLSDEAQCRQIMSSATETEILCGESITTQKIDWLVDSVASSFLWNRLTKDCGHTDLLDRLLAYVPKDVSLVGKQEFDVYLKEKLFSVFEPTRQELVQKINERRAAEKRQREIEAENAKIRAERNKKIKKICFCAILILLGIFLLSTVINKIVNVVAYRQIAGEYCVYESVDDEGSNIYENNWWLSIGQNGSIELTSYSYVHEDTKVDNYTGTLKNKTKFSKFEKINIEDYDVDLSKYKNADFCYKFHVSDEYNEYDGYLVCWKYKNGNAVDIYYGANRFSFVETTSDYTFEQWLDEINSTRVATKVNGLVDNLDISEEDALLNIENNFKSDGYEAALESIVSSRLTAEQKDKCFDSILGKTNFKTLEINGLVFHIPEHWFIRDYSDPYISGAKYPEDDSPFSLYVKCHGTVEEIQNAGNDKWKTDKDYSKLSITGCDSAYMREDSGYDNDERLYLVKEYYVECDNFVFQIQYLAYEERYFEREFDKIIEKAEFENCEENRANRTERTYASAISFFEKGSYEEALAIFETINGYKDSAEKISACKEAIKEGLYKKAVELIGKSKYKEAIELLEEIGDYKDSHELKKKYGLLSCEVGDTITFGVYEQDNNIENGAEDIEWLVLERNGNKAFVISKYCIENKPFHSKLVRVSWADSSIRKWLNGDFFNSAFSSSEKNSILSSTIKNPDDAEQKRSEQNTVDKIFLLSSNEASVFFESDSDRAARATDYVSTNHCYWILRTPATTGPYVCHVDYTGELGYSENVDREWWIRPAMWIEIG